MTNSIVIASGNANKIAELQKIAEPYGVVLCAPGDCCAQEDRAEKDRSEPPEVVEDGTSFCANATLKARAYQRWSGMPALADDTGLAVELLDGRPGIHSARYGGPGIDSHQRYELLIEEIRSKNGFANPPVRAQFHCCLVYCDQQQRCYSHEVCFPGELLEQPRGAFGVGYDPIVFIPHLGMTLAELSFEEVCRVGFRAKAFEGLASRLPEVFSPA